MKKVVILFATLIISFFSILLFSNIKAAGGYNMSEIYLNVKCYESTTNNGYDPSGMTLVNSFSHGNGSITKVKLEAFKTKTTTKNERDVIGISSSKYYLSVEYDGTMISEANGSKLYEDTSKKIYGKEYEASVAYGALLLQHKDESNNYVDTVSPVMNFFKDNQSGKNHFYSNDTYTQEYHRLCFAYETKTKIDGNTNYYYNMEVYEFIVVYDDVDIALQDRGITSDSLNVDGVEADLVEKNNTLTNNAVTTSGFVVNKMGKDVDIVITRDNKYTFNAVYDGSTYSSSGCYYVDVTNMLGTYKRTIIYVFRYDERGYNKYFEKSILDGERILNDNTYPTFTKNSKFIIKEKESYIPDLSGTITNLDTGKVINAKSSWNRQEIGLEIGKYTAVFNMDQAESGTYYKYVFNFEIVDQDKSLPSHNYNILMNRCNLEDLSFKHYEVAYQMTYGGYIYVCFSMDSYQEALDYATNIESRFIEHSEDGYFYYKAKDNPNRKDKYLSEVEAYSVAMQYAKLNVEINYFNPLDSFTYTTIDDANVNKLEGLNFSNSVRVFPSVEEKNKIINRIPYINNFIFVQVADFDVTEVKAYCKKTGNEAIINFDTPVYNQLITSSIYTITETNIYGHSISYDVYFVKENMTITNWDLCVDNETNNVSIGCLDINDGKYEVTCDSAILRSLNNELDDNTIVVIDAPGVYNCEIKFMINEIKQFELYKKGTYIITIVDRLKNNFKIIINITGKTRFNRLEKNVLTLTDLYNNIFINQIDDSNELKLDDSELFEELSKNVDSKLYTSDSFTLYMNEMIDVYAVYNNPDATQEDLDNAVISAKNAFKLLELYIDKSLLKQYIDYIEKLDSNDYTPNSYNPLDDKYLIALSVYNSNTVAQSEIDKIANELISKISLLVGRANLTNLSRIVREISNVDTSIYTTKSINELDIVMSDANKILKDLNASQDSVDSICVYLKNKYSNLVLKGNTKEISELITLINNLEYEIYISDTIKALKINYDYVINQMKEELSQEEIDSLYSSLNESYNSLIISENRKELKNLLAEKDETNSKVKEAYNKLYDIETSEEEIIKQIEIIKTKKSNNTIIIVSISIGLVIISGIISMVILVRRKRAL